MVSQVCLFPTDSSDPDAPTDPRMRREQVVDRILALNPGANLEFLAVFSDASLRQYLDHLSLVERGRGSVWVRPENMPTMVARMNMS